MQILFNYRITAIGSGNVFGWFDKRVLRGKQFLVKGWNTSRMAALRSADFTAYIMSL